jgi:aspartoacylase
VQIQTNRLEIEPVLANPLAFERQTHYVDEDLNRSFSLQSLNAMNTSGYEQRRAKEVNHLIGTKAKIRNDSTFLIDLHTTNADMGITLMTSKNDVHKLNLIKYICDRIKGVNVIFTDDEDGDRPFLGSIIEHSLLVEIGGVHNNTLNHTAYERTVNVVKLVTEFLCKLKNNAIQIEKNVAISAFSIIKKVPFPRKSDGSIKGVIHQEIQNGDFKKQINK